MTCHWGRGLERKEEASALKLRPDPTRWQCAEVMAAASRWRDLGSQFSNSSRLGFKQCPLLSPVRWGNFPVNTNNVELAQNRFLLKRMLVEKPSLCNKQLSVRWSLSRILSALGRRRWVLAHLQGMPEFLCNTLPQSPCFWYCTTVPNPPDWLYESLPRVPPSASLI